MNVINVILSYVSAIILYLLNDQYCCVILSNSLYRSIQSIVVKMKKNAKIIHLAVKTFFVFDSSLTHIKVELDTAHGDGDFFFEEDNIV